MDIFSNAQRAYLLLEDGSVYAGYSVGSKAEAIGELSFNTSVVGFQEILTDPANSNNMIVETFPLVGNYGVSQGNDLNPHTTARGYIVREWCDKPSNFLCEGRIDEYLEQKGITGIFDLDTRALTRKVRDQGNMLAVITTEELTDAKKQELAQKMKDYKRPVPAWKTNDQVLTFGSENAKYRLTMVDYGARADVIRALVARDCRVTLVPASWTAAQVKETSPEGIVLCGGAVEFEGIESELACVRELEGMGLPVLGIDFGHQLMALAAGAKIQRMHSGHRGANCPVTETASGRTFITTQNHGYVADCATAEGCRVSHQNTNDKTCEGLEFTGFAGMSVQFIPESEIGAKNFDGIYEKFLAMVASAR